MYPTKVLQWWHDGEWQEIGWRADSPESVADLMEHADKLAETGDILRLIIVGHIINGEQAVQKTWNVSNKPSEVIMFYSQASGRIRVSEIPEERLAISADVRVNNIYFFATIEMKEI